MRKRSASKLLILAWPNDRYFAKSHLSLTPIAHLGHGSRLSSLLDNAHQFELAFDPSSDLHALLFAAIQFCAAHFLLNMEAPADNAGPSTGIQSARRSIVVAIDFGRPSNRLVDLFIVARVSHVPQLRPCRACTHIVCIVSYFHHSV